MRILVVVARDFSNPSSAGGDQHLTLIARELAGSGHDVTLWCSRHPSQAATEREAGVEIRRLAALPFLAPAVWLGFLAGRARAFDLVIEDLVGGARLPFFAALLSRRPHAAMWFQDNRPLFRESYPTPVAAAAGALQDVLRLVYTRGFALVPSDATRRWAIDGGMAPERVLSVPRRQPIVGPPGGPAPFGARRPRIVCVGNLRPLKRLDESIELLARLRPSVPDAELVIIGRRSDPSYLERLELRARAPDVAGAVTIRPDAPEAEKYAILAGARLLTVHSPIEGLAWTVIEAGAFGVPSLVNDGVPVEVVADGQNGRRVPRGDLSAYAQAASALLTDAAAWTPLSMGARAVAARFTRTSPDRALTEFVGRVVGSEGGSSDPASSP